MARMIPSIFDQHAPGGERQAFNLLSNGPADWIVVHSLDLAPWNRSRRTEIDFVIVIPETGILCVEVKSHPDISFHDDRWHPAEIKRSPFKQAADARYVLQRSLKSRFPHLAAIPIVHCCIFPNAVFLLPPTLSVSAAELIDGRKFSECSSGLDLCRTLQDKMDESIRNDSGIRPLNQRISATRAEEIVRALVPVQRYRPDLREELKIKERQMDAVLREQQKPVLILSQQNSRIVVTGGAGTGKTLIAMEIARREAVKGKRVALLCYNRLVGDRIAATFQKESPQLPNLVVGRVMQTLARLADIPIPKNASKEFWDSEFVGLLEDRLTDPDFAADAQFDFLVLDEMQDILVRPKLLECLSSFLVGGFQEGRFAFFGDLENQIIGSTTRLADSLAAVTQASRPVNFRLSENCRNYPFVGKAALHLSGFPESVYSGFMRNGGSNRNFDITFYRSDDEQVDILRQQIAGFRQAGFRPQEISILSFCDPEKSAASKLKGAGIQAAGHDVDATTFTSIHAFKGMENRVVIITDVAPRGRDFERHLLYIGMTRATESVHVLCPQESEVQFLRWLSGEN